MDVRLGGIADPAEEVHWCEARLEGRTSRSHAGETPALLGGAASVLETGASAPKSLAVRRGRHDRELSPGRFARVIPSRSAATSL